jgi:cob(I)alamin adenosyltransferase
MPRITRVTTRRGDDGSTDLADGRRVRKDSPRMAAIGSLDELNSAIGAALSQNPTPKTADRLREIQNDLLCAGAMLAGSRKGIGPVLEPRRWESLEQEGAALQEKLGPLENFLLPGGTACAAGLHLARAVCRRAERDVIALSRSARIPPDITLYLNRLSDILFQYARLENKAAGVPETFWTSR